MLRTMLTILLFTGIAEARPMRTLLQCSFPYAPIEAILIVDGPGGLRILEKTSERSDWQGRSLPEQEWNARQIELIGPGDTTGYLYREHGVWMVIMKSPDGWRSSGNATCWEP